MSETIDRFSTMDWQNVSDVAKQKLIDNGEKRIRLLELSAGFNEQEWCDRGHTGYIIGGRLDIEYDDGSNVQYTEGEPLLISSGQRHKARVESGKAILFLVDDV